MHHAPPRYFEDVELGDTLGPEPLTVSRQTVVDHCRVWGYPMPNRFTDDEVAHKEGLPSAVVPAPLSMGFMSAMVSHWAADAVVKRLDVVLRGHLGHGQPARLVGVVTDKTDGGEVPEVHCDLYIESTDGVRLVGGQVVVELPSRPS